MRHSPTMHSRISIGRALKSSFPIVIALCGLSVFSSMHQTSSAVNRLSTCISTIERLFHALTNEISAIWLMNGHTGVDSDEEHEQQLLSLDRLDEADHQNDDDRGHAKLSDFNFSPVELRLITDAGPGEQLSECVVHHRADLATCRLRRCMLWRMPVATRQTLTFSMNAVALVA